MFKQAQNQAGDATVERRLKERIKAGQSVLLRTPHAHPMEAWLLDVSSSGARVRVPERIPAGENVRIEAEDLLLFGTVSRCETVNRAYEIGVALSLPLEELNELQILNSALFAHPETADRT